MRTLRNAVERGSVHHAYLFVGSRGTGKTSMAKILAACLNCERGPTVEPCGACESCLSIATASSLDVIEMDAASNNSVEDIRELRESVAYAPVSGRRKVYILDEAHMLSTAAWNAFLKTLEEPPPNTVFVLATTEAAKVPATVVDRCHRFDFQRPSVEQIASVLRRAAAAEQVELPAAAAAALARAATGSFRDALGTLEQIVTYSGSDVAVEDVLAVLGQADATLLAQALDALAAGDAAGALRTLESCLEQGRDAASFAADLEVRLRELLLVQALGEVPREIALTPEADAALVAQAERVDPATVVRTLELVGAALEAVRAGADARTRLELALVKAARPVLDDSLGALLSRLERLERGLGGQGRPSSPPRPPEQPEASATPLVAAAGAAPQAAVQEAEHERAQTRGLEGVVALWPAVVDLVRGENALLGAIVEKARPVSVRGEDLVLSFAATDQFPRKKAEEPANRMVVGEALHAVTGTRWRLSYELRERQADDAGAGEGQSEEEWLRRFMAEFDAEELSEGSR